MLYRCFLLFTYFNYAHSKCLHVLCVRIYTCVESIRIQISLKTLVGTHDMFNAQHYNVLSMLGWYKNVMTRVQRRLLFGIDFFLDGAIGDCCNFLML